jgi:DNA polymerase (family X)
MFPGPSGTRTGCTLERAAQPAVAIFHGRFKLDRKPQTERLLRAIANPYTTITGRQLQRRPGYEIEIQRVLRACAKHDVAVEINAHPWRLDLYWRWHESALDFGCMMSVNPDAHSIREFDHMHWGVEMARKGAVPPDRVLNAMGLVGITRYLRRKRHSFSRAAQLLIAPHVSARSDEGGRERLGDCAVAVVPC